MGFALVFYSIDLSDTGLGAPMKKEEVESIKFPKINVGKLEEVVRVVKYGLKHSHEISDDIKTLFSKWVQEMDAEIHAAEHQGQANPFKSTDFVDAANQFDLTPMEPDNGEPV